MLKSDKESVIKDLNERFGRTKAAVVAEFSKLSVATVTNLRRKFRESNIEYRVIKNTLAKLAAKGTALEILSEDFVGPIGLALSYGDVIAPAKIISEFTKDLESIKIRSGMVDGKRIDAAGVKTLAKLPGLNELRATILGMINQPAGKVVRTIAAPGSQLARVLQARVDQLGKQS